MQTRGLLSSSVEALCRQIGQTPLVQIGYHLASGLSERID